MLIVLFPITTTVVHAGEHVDPGTILVMLFFLGFFVFFVLAPWIDRNNERQRVNIEVAEAKREARAKANTPGAKAEAAEATAKDIKEAKSIKEAKKAEAKVRFEAKREELKAIKEAKKAEAKAIKEAKKAEAKAKEKLDADLINLLKSLPFYTRNSSDEFSSINGDNSRWNYVLKAIKKCDTAEMTLYLTKVKSLNDNNEYYQIGVTTQSIASIFLKSPDSELIEIVASRVMEKRLALFAEFHFIREFRPKESPDEGKGFSGYTKIVKENSIKKIKSLFSTLSEYEAKASSFLSRALTDKS